MNDFERLDDLIIDGLKIFQRTDMFRFSFDAIALIHFCQFNVRHSYIDLGTGTGVMPLIGTSLGASHMTGIEINETLVELAKRSVILNDKIDSVHIVHGDYRHMSYQDVRNTPFDGVLVNPPFYDGERGAKPQDVSRSIALHDSHTSLEDVLTAVQSFIKYKGRLWMIYSANRLQHLLNQLESFQFQVKRIRLVHGMVHKPAKLVLVEAMYKGNPGAIVESPLIIYEKPNVYTKEVSSWYER